MCVYVCVCVSGLISADPERAGSIKLWTPCERLAEDDSELLLLGTTLCPLLRGLPDFGVFFFLNGNDNPFRWSWLSSELDRSSGACSEVLLYSHNYNTNSTNSNIYSNNNHY